MAEATQGAEAHPARRGIDPRTGRLALALQEALTVVARVRSDRQVAEDPDSFRAHVKRLLSRADRDAREAGYDETNVRLAIYAVVAFLDESVLNSPRDMFRDWPGRPLQEEVFGDHMAGETFFQYLEDLLQRPDSPELADLLEVFQLCLLLGFRGRYGTDAGGARDRIQRATREKIQRIRGAHGPMAPEWDLPTDEHPVTHRDPWVSRLAVTAVAGLVLALATWLVFRLAQGPGLDEVRELATRVMG